MSTGVTTPDAGDFLRRLSAAVPVEHPRDPGHARRLAALRIMPDVVRAMQITPGPETPFEQVRTEVMRVLAAAKPALDASLIDILLEEMVGLGPLEALRNDPDVTDILVNRFDEVYIERNGRLQRAETAFADENHFMALVHRLVGRGGRRVDQAAPIADALLPDGSRLNVVLPPLSVGGAALSLRRHATRNLSLEQLVATSSVPTRAAALLVLAMKARWNILVTGGAGAGKTTLLNAMSAFIDAGERIVTVEDVAELQMRQRHVVRLQSRPSSLEGTGEVTLRDLVRQTLRMRADRVIVGEVRGPEAWDMLTAMNTGAAGSMSSLHANGPADAMLRLEGLVALANPTLGISAIRANIASALNIVVHVARFADGVRRITNIDEVAALSDNGIALRPLYHYGGPRAPVAEAYMAPTPRVTAAAAAAGLEELLGTFVADGRTRS